MNHRETADFLVFNEMTVRRHRNPADRGVAKPTCRAQGRDFRITDVHGNVLRKILA